MSTEIIIGIGVILIAAIWAFVYIYKRTQENNNEYIVDFIPHLFPTLGIFFTFVGIAIGLWNFDSNDIEKSIPELMDGLKTAFIVSIIGVLLLIVFSFITNNKKRKLEEGVLSEETKAIQKLTEVLIELKNEFSTTDANGNLVKPGNLLRDLYEEAVKQSIALQSFSTDLAVTVSAGFEQILNNPTEGVVAELKSVKTEIINLGNKLKDPATDMTQNIVSDLQVAMAQMLSEFKNSVSGETKSELENLASILANAGQTLEDLPAHVNTMTNSMSENFSQLQKVMQEVSSNALIQSERSTDEFRRNIDEMGSQLRRNVGEIQAGQETMVAKQVDYLTQFEEFLNSFNKSIAMLNDSTERVALTMENVKLTQLGFGNISSSLGNVSDRMKESSEYLSQSQSNLINYSIEFNNKNTDSINEINKSLAIAGDLSKEYVANFGIIDDGLKDIFLKIKSGLTVYQTAVAQSLESFLEKYTNHLTKTAEALGAAAAKQEEILEELTEQLSKLRNK